MPQRQQGVIQARTFGQSPAAANHDLANGKRKDSIPEKMDIHPISSSKPPDLKLNTKEAKQDAFDGIYKEFIFFWLFVFLIFPASR